MYFGSHAFSLEGLVLRASWQTWSIQPNATMGEDGVFTCTMWPLKSILCLQKMISSWWFQPIWKICSSKWVHLPQIVGVKTKKYFELPPPRFSFLTKGFVPLSNFALLASRERLAAGFTCRIFFLWFSVAIGSIFWGVFGWLFRPWCFWFRKIYGSPKTGGFCIYINFHPFNRIGDFRKPVGLFLLSTSPASAISASNVGKVVNSNGTGDPGDPGFGDRPAKGSGAPSSTTSPTSAPPKASRASIGHQHRPTGETSIWYRRIPSRNTRSLVPWHPSFLCVLCDLLESFSTSLPALPSVLGHMNLTESATILRQQNICCWFDEQIGILVN